MRYLIIMTFICLSACNLPGEIDYEGTPRTTKEMIGSLDACTMALADLEDSCQKTAPSGVDRPKTPTDYLGTCLYTMDKVYGDHFPMQNKIQTRPAFFFDCMENYPKRIEKYCCYERDETQEELVRIEDQLNIIRERCDDWCSRAKLKDWESCDCW